MATGPLVGMMETQAGVAAATQNCGLGTTAVLALLAVASSLTVGLEHAELAPIEAAGDGRAIWSPIAAAMGDRTARPRRNTRHAPGKLARPSSSYLSVTLRL